MFCTGSVINDLFYWMLIDFIFWLKFIKISLININH